MYFIALINFSDSDVNERCMQDARYTRENESPSFLLLSLWSVKPVVKEIVVSVSRVCFDHSWAWLVITISDVGSAQLRKVFEDSESLSNFTPWRPDMMGWETQRWLGIISVTSLRHQGPWQTSVRFEEIRGLGAVRGSLPDSSTPCSMWGRMMRPSLWGLTGLAWVLVTGALCCIVHSPIWHSAQVLVPGVSLLTGPTDRPWPGPGPGYVSLCPGEWRGPGTMRRSVVTRQWERGQPVTAVQSRAASARMWPGVSLQWPAPASVTGPVWGSWCGTRRPASLRGRPRGQAARPEHRRAQSLWGTRYR